MDEERLELSLPKEPDPKSGAAANYATRPCSLYYIYLSTQSIKIQFFIIKKNFLFFKELFYNKV